MKIDLSKLPEGTKWIAIDEDGSGDVWAYDEEPIKGDGNYYGISGMLKCIGVLSLGND